MSERTSPLAVAVYFTLWYALNIAYNLYNKRIANHFPLPYTTAAIQLACGFFWILPIWVCGTRPVPRIEAAGFRSLFVIAFFHAVGHASTVVSMGAGSVSFTHIVKASEPVFSSIVNAFVGITNPTMVNLCLLPIVGGVALASLKELSFTWVSFGGAMLSNVSFAIRGIFSKRAMKNSSALGENLSPPNIFAVLTIMSFFILLPVTFFMERPYIEEALINAYDTYPGGRDAFLKDTCICGLTYYLYNECAYLVLGSLESAVSAAVGNTIKRVVVLVASTIYFQTQMSTQSIVGCAIAILGVFLYSIVGEREKKKAKIEAKKKKKKK